MEDAEQQQQNHIIIKDNENHTKTSVKFTSL